MEKLIENNMGLVMSIVNSFHPKDQTERDDYLQAGRIGLWKALKKFNPAQGNVLSTYAWNPIRWEIIKEIRTSKAKYNAISVDECNQYTDIQEDSNAIAFWELLPSTLTQTESKIIELRLEGYNFKEISSKLNRHRSQIKKIYYSAIGKIRETNYE